jgi:GTP-binding protein EngB required for normal cell division
MDDFRLNNREQMQVLLTEWDEHLQFVIKVVKQMRSCGSYRVFVTEERLAECEEYIQCWQQKINDRHLYVAVIGEFSSGKSTFINALLRDDLLKTSALVATSVATKLRYGEALTVEVHLKGERPGTIKTYPHSRKITIPWLPGINGIDNRQLIHLITSSETFAKDVVNVTITQPSPFLANDIVIIDTPGTNALDSQHEEITRTILEREADIAIVIIPATVPLSQTFAQFLAGTLQSHLHRCLFVVTKIDQIPQSEISMVLQTLRSRLVKILGIEPPLLYACAAKVVIDSMANDEIMTEEKIVWRNRFLNREKMIIQRLQKERDLTRCETLLSLLIELLTQLDDLYSLPEFNQLIRREIQQRRKGLLAQQEKLKSIGF